MPKDKSLIFFSYCFILSTMVSAQGISSSVGALAKDHQVAMIDSTHALALRFMNDPGQIEDDWLLREEKGKIPHIMPGYPHNSDYLFFIAGLYLEKKIYDRAIALYQKAKVLDPLYPGINEVLSFCYYGLKNYDEAINYHHKVVEDYGENMAYEKAYYYRERLSLSYLIAGDSYLAKGKAMAAFTSYTMAYRSNQLSVLAQVRLAMSYLNLYNDDVKALELLGKALSLKQSEAVRVAYRSIVEAIDNR